MRGADHFNVLGPANEVIARKISRLDGETVLSFYSQELRIEFDAVQTALREADDLETLASLRRGRIDLETDQLTRHYLWSVNKRLLNLVVNGCKRKGFDPGAVEERKDRDGETFYVLVISKRVKLADLKAVFAASKTAKKLAETYRVEYDGWTVR
ncbi:MAG: ribonuclease E inhibitor RraB [Planctomycetota bacterium]